MTRNRVTLIAVALSALIAAVSLSGLQAGFTNDVALAQKKQKKRAKRRKARGRLPNYYGKVGVSAEQREKIYSIQAQYNSQIKALEKQIAELKEKRDAEIESVLTPEQKKKLAQLRAEAAEKRKSRKKSRKKKTSG